MRWGLIRRAAAKVHEAATPLRRPVRHARFHLLAWRHRADLRSFVDAGPSQLADMLRVRPDSLGVLVWPYIHRDWLVAARLASIVGHYRLVEAQRWLHVPIGPRLQLADLSEVRPGLSLQLDRPPWFLREGELTLNLFLGSQRLYSVAFSLAEDAGGPIAVIGGIQGRHIDGAKELYAELTKDLHGCRPRDFIVQSLFCLCAAIGIPRTLAIADDKRHHRHHYFTKTHGAMVSVNYDTIWHDRGGVLRPDGFFMMPTELHFRHGSEIPSRKRALYRRRYEVLHHIQAQFSALAAGNREPQELIHEPAV